MLIFCVLPRGIILVKTAMDVPARDYTTIFFCQQIILQFIMCYGEELGDTFNSLFEDNKKQKCFFFGPIFGFSILGLPPTVEWPLMHDFKFHILKSFFSTNYYQFLFFFSNAIKFFYPRKYIPFT